MSGIGISPWVQHHPKPAPCGASRKGKWAELRRAAWVRYVLALASISCLRVGRCGLPGDGFCLSCWAKLMVSKGRV